MELVLLTRKNGVTIEVTGRISSVQHFPNGKVIIQSIWYGDYKCEAHDEAGNTVDWADYNVSTDASKIIVYDVVQMICA